MAKHSRAERARRAQQNEAVVRIQEAWAARTPAAEARAFEKAVAAARARGPQPPNPDMLPGTQPRPPRPGHEPRPPKQATQLKRGR